MTPEQNKLVTDNMRLVYYLFGKLHYNEFKHGHGDDFISEGMIGLVKAAKTFDPDKGIKFATYSTRCINNQFYMYLRQLRKKEGPVVSLSTPIHAQDESGETLTLADTELMNDNSMEKLVDTAMKESELARFFKTARDKDKTIFELMRKGYTQKEVSDEIGISQSYVSRRFRTIKEKFLLFTERRSENAI